MTPCQNKQMLQSFQLWLYSFDDVIVRSPYITKGKYLTYTIIPYTIKLTSIPETQTKLANELLTRVNGCLELEYVQILHPTQFVLRWGCFGRLGQKTYFITITPFRVADVISILSTPVPARPTSFKRFPAWRTSLVTLVAERTIKAS